MAQFDVYANPDVRSRGSYPCVVQIQSDLFDGHLTRLVMPLVRLSTAPGLMPRRLSQPVEIDGEALYLAPHLCAPLPAKLLKDRIGSVQAQSHLVLDALDAVISGV